MAVDLEVLAQFGAEVTAAKAVGAQHLVGAALRQERANLLGESLHVVGRRHHRAVMAFELLCHKRHLRRVGGVQQADTLASLAVTRQLVEAGAAPDVGGHAPVLSQQFLRHKTLTQDGARTQQLHARSGSASITGFAQVHALDDLFLSTRSKAGHGVVLIEQGHIVIHVFLLLHHALQAVVQDHADLVGKGRVVADAIRNRARQNMAVAVFVLQALAVERGAPRGAAQQKAARLHVARSPGQVANALEAEHGVIHVKRHHDAVAGGVAGGRRDPAGHAAGLVDALLQHLALDIFLVIHHLVFVDRGVLLAFRVVDADLAEQPFHAEGAAFVHQDRHHTRAQCLVTQQLRQKAHIGLRGGNFAALCRGLDHSLEGLQCRHGELLVGLGAAVRQVATQCLAALVQVLHLGGVVSRFVERNVGNLAVRDRDVETVTEDLDVFVGELLGLVHVVLALAALAHAKTLDGLDQQHAWLAFVIHRRVVSRIHLLRVMATTAQVPDVVIAHLGHHLQGLGITAEEMLAHIGAVVGLEGLVVAVQRVHHDLAQRAVLVTRQQRVPVAAPQQLDHVPAGTAESAFKFLNDLAVAAHRAVQALQVAIDDKHQVVEFFTSRQADGAQAFDLVHFTVTAEHPDLAVFGVGNATGMQVLEESRLVNRHQRPQAHGDGGELPELGHELGVRVARQALAVGFLAEVQQLLFGQTAFHVGAGIHTRRHMTLNVEAVATVVFGFRVPEMVEPGTKHVRQRGKRANVAAQVPAVCRIVAVGLDHHGHGVPAHVGAQALFDFDVAGATLLLVGLDGVDVAGVGRERHVKAALTRMLQQLLQKVMGTLWALTLNDGA